MGNRLHWAALTLFLAACEPAYPQPDAGCAAACARLRHLGCPEAEPTPDGASCETVCDRVQDSGAYELNTECVTRADRCHEAEECE